MNETWSFVYEIEWYNDDEGKMERIEGLLFAKTFTKAMKIIEEYYGVEMEKVLRLEILDSGNLIEKDKIKKVF